MVLLSTCSAPVKLPVFHHRCRGERAPKPSPQSIEVAENITSPTPQQDAVAGAATTRKLNKTGRTGRA
jgi:hypothetical protein